MDQVIDLQVAYNNACILDFAEVSNYKNYQKVITHRVKKLGSIEKEDSYQRIFKVTKALSNEIRLKIFTYLQIAKYSCLCELVSIFQIDNSTLTYHLKFLDKAGLIEIQQKGKMKIVLVKKVEDLNLSLTDNK
jgi:DNA-binding transcriptional ArsR family regulator